MTTEGSPIVAALFVAEDGPYVNDPRVDAYTIQRDARNYTDKKRVIAHPPCHRWGRMAEGSPTHKRFQIGDDGGCFWAALSSVRRCGGVLEHPQGSHAWRYFRLPIPPAKGWSHADQFGGRSCYVDQGAYGHSAKKPTWLYAVLPAYPELDWTRVWDRPYIGGDGFHSAEERRRAKARADYVPKPQIEEEERYLTPPAFKELLYNLAVQELSAIKAAPGVRNKPPLRARASPVERSLVDVVAGHLLDDGQPGRLHVRGSTHVVRGDEGGLFVGPGVQGVVEGVGHGVNPGVVSGGHSHDSAYTRGGT